MSKTKVLFLGGKSVLDPTHGSSVSILNWLRVLQAHDYECHTLSPMHTGSKVAHIVRSKLRDFPETSGDFMFFTFAEHEVSHKVFLIPGQSGHSAEITTNTFLQHVINNIGEIDPDIVIIFNYAGGLANELWECASQSNAQRVFYLAIPNLPAKYRHLIGKADHLIVPTNAMAELFGNFEGKPYAVIRSAVQQFVEPSRKISRENLATRAQGFVTVINPSPNKGGGISLRIAEAAQQAYPQLTFLFVESRGGRSTWEKLGYSLSGLNNVWWLPTQKDMRRVYERSTIVLVPSLWEAAGRVIAEAQLCGIPVLATRRGGIPEQLNGGGFLFDLPDSLLNNPNTLPERETVPPWLDIIDKLMTDDAFYLESCDRAIQSAEVFLPENIEANILDVFADIRK